MMLVSSEDRDVENPSALQPGSSSGGVNKRSKQHTGGHATGTTSSSVDLASASETENHLLLDSHHESFNLSNATDAGADGHEYDSTGKRRSGGGWFKGRGAGFCLFLSFVAALVGLVLLSQGGFDTQQEGSGGGQSLRQKFMNMAGSMGSGSGSTTEGAEGGPSDSHSHSHPLIIGHRGSCGMLPEHTIEGYELAIKQGADCIECDVILTKDGVPICRHDLTLDNTTDVASRPEFASYRRERMVEGQLVEGWFAVDFLLSEIKQLRATQRMSFRDPNYNGLFQVATLQEQIDLVKKAKHKKEENEEREEKKEENGDVYWHMKLLRSFLGYDTSTSTNTSRSSSSSSSSSSVCLYPEMKSTTWHNSLHMWDGKRSEDIILETFEKNGFRSKEDNIYLQSFETLDLEYVHAKTNMKLIQLIGAPDEVQVDTKRPYRELMTKEGLEVIAKYAFAVSPSKNDIMPKNETTGYIDQSAIDHGKAFVEMIHSTGLDVHPWVLRDENRYLAWNYGQDVYNEYTAFVRDMGVDGFFTDFPKTATNYLRYFAEE